MTNAHDLIRAYELTFGSTGPGCNPPSLAAAILAIAVAAEDDGAAMVSTNSLRQLAMALREAR